MPEKKEKTLWERLNEIQGKLKVPKGQTNDFGKYKYRSCEDILEAVKPLLGGMTLIFTDEIVLIGDRYYVKATVILSTNREIGKVSVSAYAREALAKKGFDESQITGAASSYARKYCLNGLFCIDDTKDSDFTNNGTEGEVKVDKPQKAQPTPTTAPNKPNVEDTEIRDRIVTMIKKIYEIKTDDDIRAQIENYSGFEGDKGWVKGKRSTFDLSGKWLRNTYAKVKADYETWEKTFEGDNQANYIDGDN